MRLQQFRLKDQATLKIDWLGPSMSLPLFGSGGTAKCEVVYPFKAPALDFGQCDIDYVHWKHVLIRNEGNLPLQLRLVTQEDWIRFPSGKVRIFFSVFFLSWLFWIYSSSLSPSVLSTPLRICSYFSFLSFFRSE
jgi:hypothetical protein